MALFQKPSEQPV